MPFVSEERKREYNKLYRERNRERLLMRDLEYHHAHKEARNKRRMEHWRANREKNLEKMKRYNEINKERYALYHKKYREENREDINRRVREYSKTPAAYERNQKQRMNRRALKHGLVLIGKRHSKEEWALLVQKEQSKCKSCGIVCLSNVPLQAGSLTKDHIVPLKLGGDDSIENIQILCLRCNAAKGARI